MIDGVTIKDIEDELKYRKKSSLLETFCAYGRAKLLSVSKVKEFYKDPIFRKFRLNTYINTQKSESNLISLIKSKFGDPSNVILALRDYNQGKFVL